MVVSTVEESLGTITHSLNRSPRDECFRDINLAEARLANQLIVSKAYRMNIPQPT